MKKTVILLSFFMCFLFFDSAKAQKENKFDFTFQAGFNLLKSVKGNSNNKYDMKSAVPTIFIEAHFYPFKGNSLKKLGIGLGFSFYNLKTEDTEMGWLWTYPEGATGTLYWWPLYLSLKYKFSDNEKISPYVKLDNGYNIFAITDNVMVPDDRFSDAYSWGGYYFSISGGIEFAKFVTIEANYSILNSGIGTDYKYNGYWQYWDENFKTNIITISLGFTF